MADNVAITAGSGTTVSTEEVTTLNGGAVSAQHVQRIAMAVRTADATARDIDLGSGTGGSGTQRVIIDSSQLGALGQAVMNNSQPVVIASNQSAFPINPQPETSGGLSVFRSLDLDETEEAVKASAGQLYKLRIANFRTTSAVFVKLYDDTVANVSVGSTTPVDTIAVPVATAANNPTVITEDFGGMGVAFANAITAAATTALADADTGAPGANEVVVTAYYK